MDVVYTMKGEGALLEVYEDKLTITPKGVTGFLLYTTKGAKTILFSAIAGIHFKKSGGLANGYLHFTLPGDGVLEEFFSSSSRNKFEFAGQNDLAMEIKDYIEKRIHESRKPQTSQSSPSIVDEIQKLADMKAKGILSDEEFQAAKRQLLG